MKHVVSISLGSSQGNKSHEVEILGELFRIERIGTDGDLGKFSRLFSEYDGKVDALGVGGADIYVVAGEKRYVFKQIRRMVSGATHTPVVDGSGLKNTLERATVNTLQESGLVNFADERVILMSAVDRFGMAEALAQACPNVIYGDVLFSLGLPVPIRSYRFIKALARVCLPVVTRLPFQWFYPTGEKQEKRQPKFKKHFDWATIIAGDKHYIKRYAPPLMEGKTIITQTIRKADIEWLRQARASRIITTTPEMGGETFATNVMEGVLVSLIGRPPSDLTEKDYLSVLERLQWKPSVMEL